MHTIEFVQIPSREFIPATRLKRLVRKLAVANFVGFFFSAWMGALAPMVCFGLALFFCLVAVELS